MKSKSCLNLDLAHDLFEGFAIDIINLLITSYLQASVFTFDDLNRVTKGFRY